MFSLSCPPNETLYFFSDEQLRKGAFLLYVIFGVYLFTLLGFICNEYFIPCVELICDDLKIPKVSDGTRWKTVGAKAVCHSDVALPCTKMSHSPLCIFSLPQWQVYFPLFTFLLIRFVYY